MRWVLLALILGFVAFTFIGRKKDHDSGSAANENTPAENDKNETPA
jgi:hypothetical protein